jgi:pyrroline-5-carboxylate reductase
VTKQLGFIGTGTITHAIVTGLCNAPDPPSQIWISPRSRNKARDLADSYPNVHIATTNQEVLDRADTVILAVLPQVAHSVLKELVFRNSHQCISLIAGFSHASLLSLIHPASHCVRATPLPSVAHRRGPVAMYPSDAEAAALFSRIGEPVVVQHEGEFNSLVSCTAEMAPFFRLLDSCVRFMTAHNLADATARRYVGSLFSALGHTALDCSGITFEQLAREHATPGGINEQLARELLDAGVFEAHQRGLDRIFTRLCASTWTAVPDQPE